jgi:hypothetical protein
MADYAALHEAQAILDLAAGLLARINAEIVALERAQRLAEESHARVEATAAANVAVAGVLGQELRQGRKMQEEAVKMLGEGARLQASLWDTALPAAFLEPPSLASAALQPAEAFLPTSAALPDFATASRKELWQGELALSRHNALWALWDVLAENVKTFRELQEEAMARLAAAEQQLEQAEKKTHRRKAPDQTVHEEREHER